MANGQWAWHVHHMTLVEQLYGPYGLTNRQHHIKTTKPGRERARRLRLLKVVQNQALIVSLQAGLDINCLPIHVRRKIRKALGVAILALHDHECPKCPWDGTTIFPKKKKVK